MPTTSLLQQRAVRSPLHLLREVERAAGRRNRHSLGQPGFAALGSPRTFVPKLEALETETAFEITAEMPGVNRADLDVSVQEGVLTIRGSRVDRSARHAPIATATPSEGEAEDAQASSASDVPRVTFERRIRFNGEIVEEAVNARYVDGVLEITVPKPTPVEPEVRNIPIEVA